MSMEQAEKDQPEGHRSARSVVIFLLVLIAGILILLSNKIGLPYMAFSVESGSMQPTLRIGDLIFIKERPEYLSGDIVSFAPATSATYQVITHRIVEAKQINGTTQFTTKGDYNSVPDLEPLYKNQILGKYVWKIPLIGYVISFLRTIVGFILVLVIPSTIIMYQEALNIIAALQKKRELHSTS